MGYYLKSFIKNPDAVLDYGIDWAAWLNADVIINSAWVVSDGIIKRADYFDKKITNIWLSGGTVGNIYTIINYIVTSDCREDSRIFYIRCQNT